MCQYRLVHYRADGTYVEGCHGTDGEDVARDDMTAAVMKMPDAISKTAEQGLRMLVEESGMVSRCRPPNWEGHMTLFHFVGVRVVQLKVWAGH